MVGQNDLAAFAALVRGCRRWTEVCDLLVCRCPYCAQVKQLFQKLEVPAKIVELDSVVEGDDVQVRLSFAWCSVLVIWSRLQSSCSQRW